MTLKLYLKTLSKDGIKDSLSKEILTHLCKFNLARLKRLTESETSDKLVYKMLGGRMENKIDILDFFKVVKKERLFLFLSFFCPTLIAMIVSLLLPKSYTSYVKMLAPEVAAGGAISASPFGALSAFSLSGKSVSAQAIMSILQSDRMTLDIIKTFKINDLYNFKYTEDVIKYVTEEMVRIELDELEGTINVYVTTNSPEFSKNIAVFYLGNLGKIMEDLELAVEKPFVKVIDEPVIPEKKSAPKVKLNMAIAGSLGLIFGFVFIYFRVKIFSWRIT